MSQRQNPAGDAFTDDDATIGAALEAASVPCLLMSMIHMSGDASILDGDLRPVMCFLNEMQCAMSPDAQAEVRRRALAMLRDYRDRGCTLPPPPDAATLQRMMSFLVAGDVPAQYVPMMLEEMELDGVDARAVSFAHIPEAARAEFPVAVIGAGMSGILAGIRLGEAGIPYVIIEKNAGVGGTWYENRYPGCRVDVGNHFYCYSFEPNNEWTEFFARQPELQRYFDATARKYRVTANVRFETEMASAAWQEGSGTWKLQLRAKDGSEQTLEVRALISSVGQLNRPKLPDIEGMATFRGPAFHSARWDTGVDIAGKRVAVVGTGASAFQIVPEIAKTAAQVTVFQRSKQWMFPNPDYHRAVSEGARWCFRHLPYYGRWYRFLLFWPATDGQWEGTFIDPEWPDKERSANAINDFTREFFTGWIREQCGEDEALFQRVLPQYPPLAKRTLQDNGSWLRTLRQPHVELIDEAVLGMDETGLSTASGRHVDADVVVYATGFHASRFLWPMDIRGRDGVTLAERWGDDPEAYLGITVPGFPNFFVMYGPGTNLAASGSLIFHGECQARYIMGCLRVLLEQGAASMEVNPEASASYAHELKHMLARTIWSHPAVKNSWYRNSQGKVTVLSPWKLLDYWRWTREPRVEDYRVE